jgi:hypothetical protein
MIIDAVYQLKIVWYEAMFNDPTTNAVCHAGQ